MSKEESVLEEATANLIRGAAQRIRATHNLMRSKSMSEGTDYREFGDAPLYAAGYPGLF